jgi:hypothetical protein
MKYTKEYKLECVMKCKNGEHIDDPPGVKHGSFQKQVRLWRQIYDTLGESGLEHNRPTISVEDRIELFARIENGESYNINADTVAGALAASLNAEKLIMLTDVEGIKIEDELLYYTNKSQILDLIDRGIITGGMIPKVTGCLEALDSGVNSVHIIDGRVPHCLLLEIFTKSGIGTMIEK